MMNRRKFLTNSAAAVVGVALGAGVARKTTELQGTRTGRSTYKNLTFADKYGIGGLGGSEKFYGGARGGGSKSLLFNWPVRL